MADATPAFQTKANLLSSLRLSSLGTNTDADEQLDMAIRKARTDFWRKLGKVRLDALIAIPFVDPPVTNDDHMRQLANLTEQFMVRRELLPLYAATFRDGGSSAYSLWNDEGAFRNVTPFNVRTLVKDLTEEINSAITILSESDEPGDEDEIQISNIQLGSEHNPPIISGQSVFNGSLGVFGGIE